MKKVIGGELAYPALLGGVLVALVVGVLFGQGDKAAEAEQFVPSTETKVDVVKSDQFGYPVSGTVRSTKLITVRAKQSGTIVSLPVKEGDVVAMGGLLSRSVSSVLNAELAARATASNVQTLGELSLLEAKRAAATNADLYQHEAIGLSTLTKKESAALVRVEQANTLALLTGADAFYSSVFTFIDDNASFFPATALNEYETILTKWYGTAPDYVRVGLRAGGKTTALRDEIAQVDATTDLATLTALLERLTSLNEHTLSLLALAEPEFFDEKKIGRADERFLSYQSYRGSLATQGGTIAAVHASLVTTVLAAEGSDLRTNRGLSEATVNVDLAKLQASLGDELYRAVISLGEAERAVVLAEIQEGENRAYSGAVIDSVFVEEGEFVTVGTPLMTLVAPDDIELEVRIPVALRPFVGVGTSLYVGGVEVGTVDRIAPVAHGGAVTAYISFTSPFPVGETVQGALTFSPQGEADIYPVNRHNLFFGVAGAYVTSSDGKDFPVTIVYDAGDTLVVKSAVPLPPTLRPAVGVRL